MTTDRARGRRSAGIAASAGGRLPVGRGGRRAGARPEAAVQRRETLTLVAMCLGVMMTFLLVSATISALYAIRDDLHVSPSALIWIPSAYTLVVASLVLSAGSLGNLWGRKRMFCVGVVVMVGCGLLAASAGTTAMVNAAQLVSGVGGALILPARHPEPESPQPQSPVAASWPRISTSVSCHRQGRSGSRPADHARQLRSIGGRFVRRIVRRDVEVAVPAGQLTGYGFPRSPGSSCKGPIPICPQPTSLSDPGMRLLWPTGLGPGRWK